MECIYNCTASGSDAAAWVQAIGSIVAIFVAAYIPARIAAKERERLEEERKFRAASLAFVVEPALRVLKGLLAHAAGQWAESRERFLQGEGVSLEIPTSLTDRLLDLHVLGDAARPIHEAVVAVNNLQAAANSEYLFWRYDGDFGAEAEPSVDEHMSSAIAATQLAIDKVREVHGV